MAARKKNRGGLPWYAHDIEAYEKNTAHLSMLQHGAYRMMLDHYYKLAAPLPAPLQQVFRVCRAVAEEEQAAVTSVLNEFFDLREDGWHNERADDELADMAEISHKRSISGQKGQQERSKRKANASASAVANEQPNVPANAHTLNTIQSSPNGEDTRTDSLLKKICAEFGIVLGLPQHRWPGDLNAALHSGLTPEQILEGARIAKSKGKPTLSYAIGVARGLAGERSSMPKMNGADPAKFRSTDADGWRKRMQIWRDQQAKYPQHKPEAVWPEEWGGPPGSPDCKAPPEIVAEFVH